MIKVYEIPSEKLSEVKQILEAPEKESGELKGIELKTEEGKKGAKVETAKEWKINEFKRHGYLLRDSKSLGIEKSCNYLHIDADEDFFKRNEKTLIDAGANILEGKEFEDVQKKIKAGEDAAAESIGAIFG